LLTERLQAYLRVSRWARTGPIASSGVSKAVPYTLYSSSNHWKLLNVPYQTVKSMRQQISLEYKLLFIFVAPSCAYLKIKT